MSIEELTKLCQELAEVIRFHELETVDSRAAELLEQIDTIDDIPEDSEDLSILEDTESTDEWIESIRQANIVNTAR